MELYDWDGVGKESISPLIVRQVIHTPHMTILRGTFQEGAVLPLHRHIQEQVTMLIEGSLRVALADQEVILKPGEVLIIPSDVPHLVEALEYSIGIDLFTPARDDWKKRRSD